MSPPFSTSRWERDCRGLEPLDARDLEEPNYLIDDDFNIFLET